MAEDSGSGKLVIGVIAVIAIGVAGYFIYLNNRPNEGNIPEINMSREEVMSKAFPRSPDVPPQPEQNVPKIADVKKSKPTP